MARPPTLSFDRGTLLLHPLPPGKAWIDYVTWDDRVERFRLPALHYRQLIEALRVEGTRLVDHAPAFRVNANKGTTSFIGLLYAQSYQ